MSEDLIDKEGKAVVGSKSTQAPDSSGTTNEKEARSETQEKLTKNQNEPKKILTNSTTNETNDALTKSPTLNAESVNDRDENDNPDVNGGKGTSPAEDEIMVDENSNENEGVSSDSTTPAQEKDTNKGSKVKAINKDSNEQHTAMETCAKEDADAGTNKDAVSEKISVTPNSSPETQPTVAVENTKKEGENSTQTKKGEEKNENNKGEEQTTSASNKESKSDAENKNGDPSSPTASGKNGKAFFPMKLYDIVSDEKNDDIIKWLPGGKAFIIVDKKKFANEVLPKHFQQSQFTSFTRKLSRWKFTRVPRGPFIGAYYNRMFVKGNRSYCWHMRCKNENIGKIRYESTKLGGEAFSELDPQGAASHAMIPHPPNMSNIPPGAPGGIGMHAFPRQSFPPTTMPSQVSGLPGVPIQLQHPSMYPASTLPQAGVNPALNTQLLAIEGRIRELQNVRSVSAYQHMYEQQQQAFMAQQQAMADDAAYANQAQHARMIEASRAAMGMNGMLDYSNPHFMNMQRQQQAQPQLQPQSQPQEHQQNQQVQQSPAAPPPPAPQQDGTPSDTQSIPQSQMSSY